MGYLFVMWLYYAKKVILHLILSEEYDCFKQSKSIVLLIQLSLFIIIIFQRFPIFCQILLFHLFWIGHLKSEIIWIPDTKKWGIQMNLAFGCLVHYSSLSFASFNLSCFASCRLWQTQRTSSLCLDLVWLRPEVNTRSPRWSTFSDITERMSDLQCTPLQVHPNSITLP